MLLLSCVFVSIALPLINCQTAVENAAAVIKEQCDERFNGNIQRCLQRTEAWCQRLPAQRQGELCRAVETLRGRPTPNGGQQPRPRLRPSLRANVPMGKTSEPVRPPLPGNQASRKQQRCKLYRGQNKADCMKRTYCTDYTEHKKRTACRIENMCPSEKGPERNKCIGLMHMDCMAEPEVQGQQECLMIRLCDHIAFQKEKQECKLEAEYRCEEEEGVAMEACFEERYASIAGQNTINELNKKLQLKAAKAKGESDKLIGKLPNRPSFVREDGMIRQHTELTVNSAARHLRFGGDLDLSIAQADQILASLSGRQKRKVGTKPVYHRWNRMPIPYRFGSGVPTKTREIIKVAIKMWEDNTCVRFEEHKNGPDQIEFYDGDGCASYVGRVGGIQEISVKSPGCAHVGIITHEIGHALGLLHEQARPDQDKNVIVRYDNIQSDRWVNFLMEPASRMSAFSQPYDLGSVMHYDAYAFTIDRTKFGIETLHPAHRMTIGQRTGPSFVDYAQINAAYCASKCRNKLSCRRGGYTDPNNCRKCKCPDGFGGTTCDQRETVACGKDVFVTNKPAIIESPEFPKPVHNVQHCVWRFQTKPGSRLRLEFGPKFDFTCKESCDAAHVEIKDGNDWRKTGFRFCCGERPPHPIISKANEMVLIMRTDSVANRHAKFMARVTSFSGPPPTTTLGPTTSRATTRAPTTTRRPQPTTQRPTTTTTRPTTTTPPTTTNPPHEGGFNCFCGQWSSWSGTCSECGGCSVRMRRRRCANTHTCKHTHQHRCNMNACPNGNLLHHAGTMHILTNGCCLAMANVNGQCSATHLSQTAQSFMQGRNNGNRGSVQNFFPSNRGGGSAAPAVSANRNTGSGGNAWLQTGLQVAGEHVPEPIRSFIPGMSRPQASAPRGGGNANQPILRKILGMFG